VEWSPEPSKLGDEILCACSGFNNQDNGVVVFWGFDKKAKSMRV
jgi:hypothetical protein